MHMIFSYGHSVEFMPEGFCVLSQQSFNDPTLAIQIPLRLQHKMHGPFARERSLALPLASREASSEFGGWSFEERFLHSSLYHEFLNREFCGFMIHELQFSNLFKAPPNARLTSPRGE